MLKNSLKSAHGLAAVLLLGLIVLNGCQGVRQSARYWWNNNLKVGPNYATPAAPVANEFRDPQSQVNSGIDTSREMESQWWLVFGDPDLNALIDQLKSQNLSLKAACYRIKEARHLRNIAAANLFPQSQTTSGVYSHTQISRESATAFPGGPVSIDDWSTSFDASWEVDMWGRIRRSVAATDAQLDSRIHDYNFALVTLIGDAATIYVQIRSLDERIELAKQNVKLQEGSLDIASKRFEEGRTDKLDVLQAESNLATTRALIPQFELTRRQLLNALAVLLAIPPSEVPFLTEAPGKIPDVPRELLVGIPANLLLRRPDIRAAERVMAAQFEQIGIREADLYPTLAVNGTLGWQAAQLTDLFKSNSFTGTIAPGFRWNILNYGRLQQAICVEEAVFRQVQLDFENTVLAAQREVEDGIVEFIKKQEQLEFNQTTAEANAESVELALASFTEGKVDFGRVFVVQSNLVLAQDQVVETRTAIALAVIQTYKALGGGWEIPDSLQSNAVYPQELEEALLGR